MDPDLSFLLQCKNEDLKNLADYLVYDPKDKKMRNTESLSQTMAYRNYYPNQMVKIVPEMIQELQLFGGNSFVNFFRGKGVPYKTILCDVCDKLKVNFNKNSPINVIEQNLLQKVMYDSVDNMTNEEIQELGEDYGFKNAADIKRALGVGTPMYFRVLILISQALVKRMGIAAAAQFLGGRLIAILAGPVAWIATGIWAAIDIAGPAYRVTTPCVVLIATMRAMLGKTDEEIAEFAK